MLIFLPIYFLLQLNQLKTVLKLYSWNMVYSFLYTQVMTIVWVNYISIINLF